MNLKRIKDLREDHDLSQQQVAEYLNISQRTYSHYETGSRGIPIDILIQLSVFYHVSLDYLTSLKNEKNHNKV